MPREVKFVQERGCLGEALGVSKERAAHFDSIVNAMIDQNANLIQVINRMLQEEMTDNEWTTFVYGLGYMDGWNRRG